MYPDQDPTFETNLFTQLMKQLGINKSRTRSYNPKANGLCEKSNGTVKGFLLKYVNFFGGEREKWFRELIYISTQLYIHQSVIHLMIIFCMKSHNTYRYFI